MKRPVYIYIYIYIYLFTLVSTKLTLHASINFSFQKMKDSVFLYAKLISHYVCQSLAGKEWLLCGVLKYRSEILEHIIGYSYEM